MPTTSNRGFIVPNTGDLVDAWGTTALNPNFGYLDGTLGGVATISLSGATVFNLTANTAAITPSAGPFQQNNAVIKFSGTLTGNAVAAFTQPGYYIVWNTCVVGSFYVALAPTGGLGKFIGAPPGRLCHVFYDGTDMNYVDMPEVGSALDLHAATALPAWMTACTVAPYLIKDGTVYAASSYTALAAALGSTFGGNGVSTFGVPDERARARIAYDPNATGRLTTAVSGVNGNTMGSAGGDQNIAAHSHANVLVDPGHTHTTTLTTINAGGSINVFGGSGTPGFGTTGNSKTGMTITNATTGSGVSANVQPSIVSFLPLIKT